ncbi:hypothetical protein NSA47_02060 [Irregularibacter muris]|uniref:Uncharacterized protein n=1 Tax=Irregularibacter muris TaxID=1796619 RepID=A0AAE3HE57_9FIRM|nr:hypothetical protein [Irregularibacter muris]MCR1897772.1 hypothetical protein [Irregularibacter muris]
MSKEKKDILSNENPLNTMPTGMLRGIEDQSLINMKIKYYGELYTKKFPDQWINQNNQ